MSGSLIQAQNNLSLNCFWLLRYMMALREMPEGLSSEQKLERFLTDLTRYRDVSASTQNQALLGT
jgi:hypothetical protein